MTESTKRHARTWSAFGDVRRLPSEYEITTEGSNWTLRDGRKAPLEQNPSSPANLWLTTYRDKTPLSVPDWTLYRDPDALTYRRYVGMQDDEEIKVAGVLEHGTGSDANYDPAWAQVLLKLFTSTRFPLHGMQMVQAYIGQIAPSPYITNPAALAAADLLRRVSLIAYRTRELQIALPDEGFGVEERRVWEGDESWQSARKAVEHALIAYDFSEALTAANLVLLPTLDNVLLTQLAELAEANGDEKTRRLLDYLQVDSDRRNRWSFEIARFVVEQRPQNAAVLDRWLDRWTPRADAAAAGLGELFATLPKASVQAADVAQRAADARNDLFAGVGLAARINATAR